MHKNGHRRNNALDALKLQESLFRGCGGGLCTGHCIRIGITVAAKLHLAASTLRIFDAVEFTEPGLHGTDAEASFDEERIVIQDFRTRQEDVIEVPQEEGRHGGGDERVVKSWLQAVADGNPAHIVTDVQESLRTHTTVFAAEKSRLEKRTVDVAELVNRGRS